MELGAFAEPKQRAIELLICAQPSGPQCPLLLLLEAQPHREQRPPGALEDGYKASSPAPLPASAWLCLCLAHVSHLPGPAGSLLTEGTGQRGWAGGLLSQGSAPILGIQKW